MFNTAKAKQVTVKPEYHSLIKEYAMNKKCSIHIATAEILETGLRVKRLLPSETEQQSKQES